MSYPIILNMAGKTALVVGGGSVAARRVHSLLDAGAVVRVVAPDISNELADLANMGKIRLLRRKFRLSDLNGVFLAHIATSSHSVNRLAAAQGLKRGILVCVADDPLSGSFITPGSIRHGRFIAAVSSGGDCPSLTAVIREDLARQFGSEYGGWAELFAELRERLQRLPSTTERKAAVRRVMASPEMAELIARSDLSSAIDAANILLDGSPAA
jgi:precorrin-2 dehydrogenase/sirohydrochlorin ferrochelatase